MLRRIRTALAGTPVERLLRAALRRPTVAFDTSGDYWERRYRAAGTSGAGSYGRLAAFKAEVLNRFVAEHAIGSVIEFGSGDGNQAALFDFPRYTGFDVSDAAVALCREKFAVDPTKSFHNVTQFADQRAELTLSLDVIYHLVEDAVFERYMTDLFAASTRYVGIYSSDRDDPRTGDAHVRHRRFSDWIARHAPDANRILHVPNPYPENPLRPGSTSFAEFHFYEIGA